MGTCENYVAKMWQGRTLVMGRTTELRRYGRLDGERNGDGT